jgi:predicted nucleotidyltransferase
MRTQSTSPTPYPDVNEILDALLANAQKILAEQLIGMYLFGSLANGDFDQHSDVDVLIVTDGVISEDRFHLLKVMHEGFQEIDSPWATQLEVSYFPLKAIRRYEPKQDHHPHLDRGLGEQLHVMAHETDWIVQRHILRERGITVVGPEPKTFIDFVSGNDLQSAMLPILFQWYAKKLEQPNPFGTRGYQSYVVLSICRILYTLQTGEVVSKPVAARWAEEALDQRWAPLIDRALIGRQTPDLDPDPFDVRKTFDLIRYALGRAAPTPYPDINDMLSLLLSSVKGTLGDQFVGMYLYGSLSSGDFNPETSDIDFLVVTKNDLSSEKIAALKSMHEQIWARGMQRAARLEGSYVSKDLIRRHDSDGAPCPTVNEGEFYMGKRGSDWIIQRHIVRECGVIVEGPDPKTLIDPVTPDDIRSAVQGILQEWWFPMLEDPSWLKEHGSNYHGYAAITMCRAMHALEHGTIVSKPAAVRWAKEELGSKWHTLIEQAVASQYGIDSDFYTETVDFIRFTRHWISQREADVHDP